MVKLRQKVKFDPFKGIRSYGVAVGDIEVVGTVVYINFTHRWFEVSYPPADGNVKTSFKFDEVGKNVFIVQE